MTVSISSDDLQSLDPSSPDYAVDFVDRLLSLAVMRSASDIHLLPQPEGLVVELRLNGVLERLGHFPVGEDSDPVVRLKVLANLLTYKTHSPQEGRLAETPNETEMRVSTFPTIHGERAVVRLFAAAQSLNNIESLDLPADISESLSQLCMARDGGILITGPAGSGKTTTLYACLRRIADAKTDRRSVLTIEDPVESTLENVSQSQLEPALGMTLDAALRSMLRQDPQVVMVGEIRDPATAEAALQASLTGHLVFSSLHAGDVSTALRRLVEMKIPPYLIRSGVRAIVSQRLLRKLCGCRRPSSKTFDLAAIAFEANGCDLCHGTGYVGRIPVAELLHFGGTNDEEAIARAIQEDYSASKIYASAIDSGMIPLKARAAKLIEEGVTSLTEVHRMLGSAAL